MKAQSADKMKETIQGIVANVCPSFWWKNGEVLVVEKYPYEDLYIECLDGVVSVGFYRRVYGESLPSHVFYFYLFDWTVSGYQNMEGQKYAWLHKDILKGRFNQTSYNGLVQMSIDFSQELEVKMYGSGKVKNHFRPS